MTTLRIWKALARARRWWGGAILGLTAAAGFAADTGDLPDTLPTPIKQSAPEYPYQMRMAGLQGVVLVEFLIDTQGDVVNPYVVETNNPWFERPALDAILRWKFRPGMNHGRPVNVRAQQKLQFDLFTSTAADGLWQVSGSPRKKDNLPETLRWTEAPTPVFTSFPVYPFADLQAGRRGETRIKFVVGPTGSVVAAEVVAATTPEMGRAALAMIDTWRFTPAKGKGGAACSALLSIEHEFRPNGAGDVPVAPEATEIQRLLVKNPAAIVGAAKLDHAPKPLSRRPPVYPSSLLHAQTAGSATVDFYIDRRGDAQLASVVESTQPEFGYAAVQAVATWRFEPPLLAGKPVVAHVRVPVAFAPK